MLVKYNISSIEGSRPRSAVLPLLAKPKELPSFRHYFMFKDLILHEWNYEATAMTEMLNK